MTDIWIGYAIRNASTRCIKWTPCNCVVHTSYMLRASCVCSFLTHSTTVSNDAVDAVAFRWRNSTKYFHLHFVFERESRTSVLSWRSEDGEGGGWEGLGCRSNAMKWNTISNSVALILWMIIIIKCSQSTFTVWKAIFIARQKCECAQFMMKTTTALEKTLTDKLHKFNERKFETIYKWKWVKVCTFVWEWNCG